MSTTSFHHKSVTDFIDRLPVAFAEQDPRVADKVLEAENVLTLQTMYQALARGDFDAFAALLAADVEFEMVGPADVPMCGRAVGPDGVMAAAARNYALLADQQAELLSLVAQGDLVVLIARETGRVRATGKTYDIHWTRSYTFRNGLLTRAVGLCDTAALKAAATPD